MRRSGVLCVWLLVVAACSGSGGERVDATAFTIASTTTTAPTLGTGGPDFYRYGDDGVLKVVGGVETLLIERPVAWVADDLTGGLIFTYRLADDVYRLSREAMEPVPITRRSGYAYPRFTGVIDGRPVLFFAGMPEGFDLDEWECVDWSLNSRDLVTGKEVPHLCLPMEDGWFGIESIGNGRLVGDIGIASGSCGTSSGLRFWDLHGSAIQVAHNPFSDSCEPCELSAMISPDGALLAYSFRPDAKWPPQEWDHVSMDDWWEQSKHIPGEVVVVSLDTGEAIWRQAVPSGSRLADFDGRFVAVGSGTTASGTTTSGATASGTIYDTFGEHSPITVSGGVTLIRSSPA